MNPLINLECGTQFRTGVPPIRHFFTRRVTDLHDAPAPPTVLEVTEEMPLNQVIKLMLAQGHRTAIVVDRDNQPEGIFTSEDALRALLELMEEHFFESNHLHIATPSP